MSTADFDALSDAAFQPEAGMPPKDALFAATFSLPNWFFIARGEFPEVRPYIAGNAAVGNGEPMLKAFTDTRKLQAAAREWGIVQEKKTEPLILSIPLDNILPMMDDYADQDVWGIHFNADSASNGFFVPLRQLPVIRKYLEGKGLI